MPKEPNATSQASRISRFFFFIANGFGLGLIPIAPGSFGTLLGFGLYFLIADLSLVSLLLFFILTLGLSILCIEQSKNLTNEVDDKRIVIDEYFAFAMLLYFIPTTPLYWLFAYLLFRFFDIAKPFPIRQIDQNFKTSFGVMLDDLLAAGYSYLVIYGFIFLQLWLQQLNFNLSF